MPRYMSPEEKEEVLRLYNSGVQQKIIAKKFGRARSSINYFIKQEIEKVTNPTDDTLFDHLDYYKF